MQELVLHKTHSFFDWCLGIGEGTRHFRAIIGKHEGKNVCADCARILLIRGYTYTPYIPPPPPTKPKRGRKSPRITERFSINLRTLVLSVLGEGEGRACTVYQLLPLVKEATSSIGTLKITLSLMKQQGEIIAERSPYKGQAIYALPGNIHLIHKMFASPLSILELLALGRKMTVAEIATCLERSPKTVARWVEKLSKKGEIKVERQGIRGLKGTYKICWLP